MAKGGGKYKDGHYYRKRTQKIVRFDNELLRRFQRIIDRTGRSFNAEITALMMDALGEIGYSATIVFSGQEYVYLSPAGFMGPVDADTFKRFASGRLPLSDDSWKDAFDSMEEACSCIGREVCRQAHSGVLVRDPELFVKMINSFR